MALDQTNLQDRRNLAVPVDEDDEKLGPLKSSDLLRSTDPLLSPERVRRVSSQGSTLRIDWEEGRRRAYAVAVPTSPRHDPLQHRDPGHRSRPYELN